uniref:uncharacterized protein LOC120336854 n=1 Tax=Styela clava TaxID=7725 RepID=UPI00193A5C7E|nr:uncharacterized protein LOC120336854 [Styela clava]
MQFAVLILSAFFIGIHADGHLRLSSMFPVSPSDQSFRYPAGCPDRTCVYMASWRYLPTQESVQFSIKARVRRGIWAAIGFSNDRFMPDSDAITGFYPLYGDDLIVKDRYLKSRNQFQVGPDEMQDLPSSQGTHIDGLLSFTFIRPLVTGDTMDLPLNNCPYFLYAWGGNAYGETAITVHTMAIASQERVCIRTSPQRPPQTPPPIPYVTRPPASQYQTRRVPQYSMPTATIYYKPTTSTPYVTQPPISQYQTRRVPQYSTQTVPKYYSPTTESYKTQYARQYISRDPPQYIRPETQSPYKNRYPINPRFPQYPTAQPPTPPIPTYVPDEGYEDDGVFRYPKNCASGIDCEYEAKWESFFLSEDVWFTITAKVEKGYWAGIGFSDDPYMPNSDCVTGHMQEYGHNFVLTDRYLKGRSPDAVGPDKYQDVSATSYGHHNGMLKFVFKRKRNTYDINDKNLYNCVYFLFAWGGRAHQGGNIAAHTHKYVSKIPICLGSIFGSTGSHVGTSYREPTYDFLRRPMPHYYDPCQRIACKWNQYCVRYGNHQAKCECRGRFRLVGTYCVGGPLRYY